MCGKSVDTFSQKNCSVLSDDAKSRPAVWPVGRRTPAVATGQCAGTTLARVVRGSAKAGAEMQTARILNVSPPTWRYKSCALFALQSIYLNSECGFGVSAFFADFGGIGVRTQHTFPEKKMWWCLEVAHRAAYGGGAAVIVGKGA